MSIHDPRVDAYIAKSAGFAQPILEHLRVVVHATCPDVEESLKWGMPFFNYHGAPICMMAAFKQHCGFGFWRYRELVDEQTAKVQPQEGMGQFGKLTSGRDLPASKELAALIRKAMALNKPGTKPRRPRATSKPAPQLPEDFATLLAQKKHAAARSVYDGFGPSAQREYVEWVNDAKTAATRQKHLANALEWLAEGKQRNWKYSK